MYAVFRSGGGSMMIRFDVFSFRLKISLRRRVERSGSSRDTAPGPSRSLSDELDALLPPTSYLRIDPVRLPASIFRSGPFPT